MNKESISNRRLLAIILVIAILVVAFLVDRFVKLPAKSLDQKIYNKTWDSIMEKTRDQWEEDVLVGGNAMERIVVLDIEGAIGPSNVQFLQGGYDHNHVLAVLDYLREGRDPTIKGLVLRVDSPGGTVYHSAELWDRLEKLKEESQLPIYTSMGSMAASGGYYIAAATDKIFAAEETMTGSIGVIADYVNYRELEKKLGIEHNVFKSAQHKDIGSASREATEEERAILQAMIDESFDQFVAVVAQGRGMEEARVREIGDGRIYSGRQALENGLVDQLGYFEDVLAAMEEDLGLDKPEVISLNMDRFYLKNALGLGYLSTDLGRELGYLDRLRDLYGENNRLKLLYMHGGF